jgi:ABC-type transport system involved in multi-copper enzyme maturation permease subunit
VGIRTIAELTFREAFRRRIATAAGALGLAFLLLYGAGLYLLVADTPMQGISDRTPPVMRRMVVTTLLMMGLYAANWLVVLMTVLCSVDTLSGEIASGTMQSLATKPIRRWQLVMGKWLGFAAMLTPFLILLAGGVVLEMWLMTGHLAPGVPRAIALMWVESLLLLAVTLRAGASLSTLATGALVLGLHILAFMGGWIEEFGTLAGSRTAANIGVVTSLVMPTEALWRRAAFELQGPVIGGFGRTPFATSSVPSPAMVVYAALYMVAALALAVRKFTRRDI